MSNVVVKCNKLCFFTANGSGDQATEPEHTPSKPIPLFDMKEPTFDDQVSKMLLT